MSKLVDALSRRGRSWGPFRYREAYSRGVLWVASKDATVLCRPSSSILVVYLTAGQYLARFHTLVLNVIIPLFCQIQSASRTGRRIFSIFENDPSSPFCRQSLVENLLKQVEGCCRSTSSNRVTSCDWNRIRPIILGRLRDSNVIV